MKCRAEGQCIDVEEPVCLWVWEEGAGSNTDVVKKQWVMLWGNEEGQGWAGGIQQSGESCLGGAMVKHCATFGVHRQDNGSVF